MINLAIKGKKEELMQHQKLYLPRGAEGVTWEHRADRLTGGHSLPTAMIRRIPPNHVTPPHPPRWA